MAQPPKATILDHFAVLDDPKVGPTRRHKLVDNIAIAICATICGADSWVHIELFGCRGRLYSELRIRKEGPGALTVSFICW